MGDAEAEVSSSTSVSAKKPKNETQDGNGEPNNEAQSRMEVEEKLSSTTTEANANVLEPSDKNSSSSEYEITTSGIHIGEQNIKKDEPEEKKAEEVELKVVFNKQPLPIRIALNKTIGDLKKIIETQTGVSPALQKVVVRGIPSDDSTLASLNLTQGSKILVIGTKLDEVLKMSKPVTAAELKEKEDAAKKSAEQNWSQMPQHRKIIDKGVPEDVMPGILNERDPLPDVPLHGMLSSKGSKVRLTFKLASDELWIGTKERTDKVPIQSIRSVVSQPITGFEHYHIMAIQLGPTEASRFYIYWVPAQYVDAIKEVLNG